MQHLRKPQLIYWNSIYFSHLDIDAELGDCGDELDHRFVEHQLQLKRRRTAIICRLLSHLKTQQYVSSQINENVNYNCILDDSVRVPALAY